ncbi:MAG: kinase [Blastocatellia bacterium]
MERLISNPPVLVDEQGAGLATGEGRRLQKIGYGSAIAHHGELFQGVLESSAGRLQRGLVSLPCHIFKSEAEFFPDATGGVRVDPAWKIKARKAAELTLARYEKGHCGGLLKVWSNTPVGWGLGSSTSDVTAAIRAVADAFNERLSPREIARLAVKAEIASDSIMFGESAVLFAQREGVVIEELGGPLPPLEVLGFNTEPGGSGIDTLSFRPARYSWREIESFRPLIGLLRRAVATQNPRLIGQVAIASAEINQSHLPKPRFESLKEVMRKVGAVGLQVAHSGIVMGLLFDPKDEKNERRVQAARKLVAEMNFDEVWRFRTS